MLVEYQRLQRRIRNRRHRLKKPRPDNGGQLKWSPELQAAHELDTAQLAQLAPVVEQLRADSTGRKPRTYPLEGWSEIGMTCQEAGRDQRRALPDHHLQPPPVLPKDWDAVAPEYDPNPAPPVARPMTEQEALVAEAVERSMGRCDRRRHQQLMEQSERLLARWGGDGWRPGCLTGGR